MAGRGGRDRFQRDFPSRYEDKAINNAISGRSSKDNPPSRHLWVGNLPHHLLEGDLTRHFIRFGQLESVAFQPGRSYAFINFRKEVDANDAMRALQGYPVAGNPLRIEFAKADKSSAPSDGEKYSQRQDERSLIPKGSPFSQRELRGRDGSPEPLYPDKSKTSDRGADPSEVLWIGFPASLMVDETILRKAFSPFGEIEKITTFPGRSYAFVRFRSLMSACKARENLQGKLFGNPRVHICFAKSESGSSDRSSGRQESYENFREDHIFGSFSRESNSQVFPNWSMEDYGTNKFKKNGTSWTGRTNTYKQRSGDKRSDLGLSQDLYEYPGSPTSDRLSRLHGFPQRFPQNSSPFEDSWDLPEDVQYIHEAKKLKTGSLPLDNELPEYPLSNLERQGQVFPRLLSEFLEHEAFDRSPEARPFAYTKNPDPTLNLPRVLAKRSESWKQSSESFQVGSVPLQSNYVERRFTPESDKSSLTEWKWEGTIAKGGTAICRARCFPVGKALDIMLPEFLDCTARTGLEMLSKHYYQAAGAWVVFFVPESDADIVFYNEFLHYLEEKQRAAVSKLDDRNTLFLVPPSEFSEKVLKVPGKLSISGVVLRLEPLASNYGSIHNHIERRDANSLPFNGERVHTRPSMPSEPVPLSSFPESGKVGMNNRSFLGNVFSSAPTASFSASSHSVGSISDPLIELRHEYNLQRQNPRTAPNWPSLLNSVSAIGTLSSEVLNGCADSSKGEQQQIIDRAIQDGGSSQYTARISGIPSSGSRISSLPETTSAALPMPVEALQQEHARLSSSLGQQRQSRSPLDVSTAEGFRQNKTISESEIPTTQFGQIQQQMSNVPQVSQMVQMQTGSQGNPPQMNAGVQETASDGDTQKRLQATLQLAAALLQQIQQGKGS